MVVLVGSLQKDVVLLQESSHLPVAHSDLRELEFNTFFLFGLIFSHSLCFLYLLEVGLSKYIPIGQNYVQRRLIPFGLV